MLQNQLRTTEAEAKAYSCRPLALFVIVTTARRLSDCHMNLTERRGFLPRTGSLCTDISFAMPAFLRQYSCSR